MSVCNPIWETSAALATPAKAIFSNNSLFIKAFIPLARNFMNRALHKLTTAIFTIALLLAVMNTTIAFTIGALKRRTGKDEKYKF
jgi:hypothetical protein